MISNGYIKRISCILFIFAFFSLNNIVSLAFAGECLESNEEKYQTLFSEYQRFKSGKSVPEFSFFGARCWQVSKKLNRELESLLKEMLFDKRLSKEQRDEVVFRYLDIYGPTETSMPFVNEATGEARNKIIGILLYKEHPATFDPVVFIKQQIVKPTTPELRLNMLERLARFYVYRFDEFKEFCEKNNIEISDRAIFVFKDLKAIDYLFEHPERLTEGMDLSKGASKYYSEFIRTVLSAHLDIKFPFKYLKVMRYSDLRLLKNGIYATYGKNFMAKSLQYYYYGEYPYVQTFCRGLTCGLGDRKKGQFKENDLTETDKANISLIASIEKKKLMTGEIEPELLIENYDLNAFLSGKADNFTLASPQLQNLQEIKIDWDRKQIFIWDKHGISGWNLATGKRFKLIEKAQGPIGYAPAKRLLSYQLKGMLKIAKIDSDEIVFETNLDEFSVKYNHWMQSLNYFTKDENYFLFATEPGKLGIYDLSSRTRTDIGLGGGPFACYGYSEEIFIGKPLVVTRDNMLIVMLYNKFMVMQLNNPSSATFLKYSKLNVPTGSSVCTLALSPDENFVYIEPGYQQPIQVFKTAAIATAQDTFPDPDSIINYGTFDLRNLSTLEIGQGIIFHGDFEYLGWIDLTQLKPTSNKIVNVFGRTTDFILKDKIFAVGNKLGYVVFQKYPAIKQVKM